MMISVELDKIPFFRDIPKDIILKLTNSFSLVRFEPQTTVIPFDTVVDAIYLIVEGSVFIYTADKQEVIANLNFGSAIGEVSLFISEQRATANVVAGGGGCTLLVMPKKIINEKILSDNSLAVYFYKGMCMLMAERLSSTNRVVANKIAELKFKLKSIIDDSALLKKIKNTQQNIEQLGSQIFTSLSQINELLEKSPNTDPETIKSIVQAKENVEKILLHDLQSVDRIAQKLGLAVQYLENIERALNNQVLANIKGDRKLFENE